MNVIKKDGTLEEYNEQKIINACNKAARRAMIDLSEKEYAEICNSVWDKLVENDLEDTEIYEMHNIVESVLEELQPQIAKMYKEYRNYKKDFIHMMDKVYSESQSITVIVKGSQSIIDSLNPAEDIEVTVDISGLTPREEPYELPVKVVGKNSKLTYTARNPKVKIIIFKK